MAKKKVEIVGRKMIIVQNVLVYCINDFGTLGGLVRGAHQSFDDLCRAGIIGPMEDDEILNHCIIREVDGELCLVHIDKRLETDKEFFDRQAKEIKEAERTKRAYDPDYVQFLKLQKIYGA